MRTVLFYIGILFLLIACRKKILSDAEFANNYNRPSQICIYMNGAYQPYIVQAANITNNKIGFYFRKIRFNNTRIQESSLSIDNINLVFGRQTLYRKNFDSVSNLKRHGTFFTRTSDGDALADTYSVVEKRRLVLVFITET
jgi:hypothetical protein